MGIIDWNAFFIFVLTIAALLLGVRTLRSWQEQQYKLQDKVILITGGSRGLGLVMARMLAQQGARIALCARDAEELDRVRTELEQVGAEVFTVPCDVTNQEQATGLIQTVQHRFGTIDVLINNAGIITVAPLELMTLADFDEAIKSHFWAPLYTMQAVLPQMRQHHSGRIVNISSFGGKVSAPHLVPYCASKFALVGLSEGFHAELKKDGITVTTVCPGLIRTGSQHNALFKGKHQQEYAWFSTSASLPFASMSTESVARQTIAAFRRKSAEVVLSFPAQLGTILHGLFPGFVTELMVVVNRFLPKPDGIGSDRAAGKDSHSWVSPSIMTALTDQAAIRNNEISPSELQSNSSDQ